MSASVGDVLNDGRSASTFPTFSKPGILVQGNNFWVPEAGTSGDNLALRRTWRTRWAIELGGWSFGGAVRRPEQRRISGSVRDQRQRLCSTGAQLLV